MYKKGLIGIAVLAVMIGGVAITLIPITFAASGSPQQISPVQYYPMPYGQRWRYWPHRYMPYGGYQDNGLSTYPSRGYACPGMGWGYSSNLYWNDSIPPMYRNYSLPYGR